MAASIRWRSGSSAWVDPMEEEALKCGDRLEFSRESTIQDSIVEKQSSGFFTLMDSQNYIENQEIPLVMHPLQKNENATSGIRAKRDQKTSKSKLFEICAANEWKPPLFLLFKEDGPCHERRFTYKVVVEVRKVRITILECFSEPKTQKKAAQEHAAEGALWFLRHLGYT